MDYDPATVIDGEYIVVFKQEALDDESKFSVFQLSPLAVWSLNVACS